MIRPNVTVYLSTISAVEKPSRGPIFRLAPGRQCRRRHRRVQDRRSRPAGQTANPDLDPIPLATKVAVVSIARERRFAIRMPDRYRYPPIRVGEHVHVHNLKSDYFPDVHSR